MVFSCESLGPARCNPPESLAICYGHLSRDSSGTESMLTTFRQSLRYPTLISDQDGQGWHRGKTYSSCRTFIETHGKNHKHQMRACHNWPYIQSMTTANRCKISRCDLRFKHANTHMRILRRRPSGWWFEPL